MFIAIWLVVWNMNFIVPFSWELTFIPTDEVICFRGIGILPTRLVYLWYIYHIWLWWIRLWWIILWWIILWWIILWWIYDISIIIYISLYIYLQYIYSICSSPSMICDLWPGIPQNRHEDRTIELEQRQHSGFVDCQQWPNTNSYIYICTIYILYI